MSPPTGRSQTRKLQAERALKEAAERRAERESRDAAQAKAAIREVGGPAGPEPTRYGDWEKKGLASDF